MKTISLLVSAVLAVMSAQAMAEDNPEGRTVVVVSSPKLTKLVSTRVISRRITSIADIYTLQAGIPEVMPGSIRTMKCQGPGSCYLKIDAQAYVDGGGGLFSLAPHIDGQKKGASFPAGELLGRLARAMFILKLSPGKHQVGVWMSPSDPGELYEYDVTYQLFKP